MGTGGPETGDLMKRERFEEFLSKNEKRIFNYIWHLTRNETDAQDVTQAAFIAFFEHIESIDESSAVAYMYKIAYNKSITFIKNKARYVEKDPADFQYLAAPVKPEEPDYSALHAAMKELPPKLAGVIHLQYFEKLSYKEIASQLGTTVKAVESLCVRAKKILRKKLMQESGGKGV